MVKLPDSHEHELHALLQKVRANGQAVLKPVHLRRWYGEPELSAAIRSDLERRWSEHFDRRGERPLSVQASPDRSFLLTSCVQEEVA